MLTVTTLNTTFVKISYFTRISEISEFFLSSPFWGRCVFRSLIDFLSLYQAVGVDSVNNHQMLQLSNHMTTMAQTKHPCATDRPSTFTTSIWQWFAVLSHLCSQNWVAMTWSWYQVQQGSLTCPHTTITRRKASLQLTIPLHPLQQCLLRAVLSDQDSTSDKSG